MSTTYVLECRSSDKRMKLTIVIVDDLIKLPGSDTWTCDPPTAMGVANGTVHSWGQAETYLHAGTAGAVVQLEGFRKTTKVGDSGAGSKADPDGTFPSGGFTWQCLAST